LWFGIGAATGGYVMAKALGRRPRPRDLRWAVTTGGAAALEVAARLVRPKARR